MKTRQRILTLCTLLLLALWIPVALDKLWDLEGFHRTLLRQPFPGWWADMLYWLLPIFELACAVLLAGGAIDNPKTNKLRKWGFALSSLLLCGFALFILFGVLGWYEKRPCGCGSVISGLGWEEHLWFNLGFLSVSLVGWWLSAAGRSDPDQPSAPVGRSGPDTGGPSTADSAASFLAFVNVYYTQLNAYTRFRLLKRFRYPRRFALFPGRPVQVLNYDTTSGPSSKVAA